MPPLIVVNCSQIFCTFAVETTIDELGPVELRLWIALKFFVLLQSKQQNVANGEFVHRCELLSNFLYFCSRNNCSQAIKLRCPLWIALKFFVLLQSKQLLERFDGSFDGCELLSNFLYFCSRNNTSLLLLHSISLWIALKFFVLLQSKQLFIILHFLALRCELLSNFLYFCSRNNQTRNYHRIIMLWIALKFFVLLQSKQPSSTSAIACGSCELLSNFLYFCSRNNLGAIEQKGKLVVNCSQIFCTFAVETTITYTFGIANMLWIALKFFVLLQSKQL